MKSILNNIFWCKSCLNMSTRNRITFDERGYCNACCWSEEKKLINWNKRQRKFEELIESIKNNRTGPYDLIIPVSGGKDGSYVTYTMINKYGLKPLCITVNPPLRTDLGYKNLETFKDNNIHLLEINPPNEIMRKINKLGFINQGRPLYGWTTSIFTAIARIANSFNIDLIMYGEDGEVEYGGNSQTKDTAFFDIEYIKKIYLENSFNQTYDEIESNDFYYWTFNENRSKNIKLTHWSYFEEWDSYRNYLVAKENFGLKEKESQNTGTYTNFSQNDTYLYDLHTFLMYIKFGFGRATQDVGIDIRRGSMTRDQGIQLIKIFENNFPINFLDMYLDYFRMTKEEFEKTMDYHTNKSLFTREEFTWTPLFEIV